MYVYVSKFLGLRKRFGKIQNLPVGTSGPMAVSIDVLYDANTGSEERYDHLMYTVPSPSLFLEQRLREYNLE